MTKEQKEEFLQYLENLKILQADDFYREGLDMAISALKGGWIPIEEREPNNYDEALVCTDTEEIFKATYYAWEGFDDDNGNAYSGEIIAWQPLPKPYEKGE